MLATASSILKVDWLSVSCCRGFFADWKMRVTRTRDLPMLARAAHHGAGARTEVPFARENTRFSAPSAISADARFGLQNL